MLVYLLTNTHNGKHYVGQTKFPVLSKRWCSSLSNSPNPHLANSIAKYGPEAFDRQILAYASSQEELDLLEQFYIALLRTTDRKYGYNLMAGGRQGPGRHIESVKERIAEGSRRMWARKSPKDRWEFQLATKLRWLSRSEDERLAISHRITQALTGKPKTTPIWNKGLDLPKGRPSPKKGKHYGPQKNPCQNWEPKSEEHRKNISEGLKMYFAKKRLAEKKKPPQSVKQLKPNKTASKPVKRSQSVEPIRSDRLRKRFESLGGCTW